MPAPTSLGYAISRPDFGYFSAVETLVNTVLRDEPKLCTTAIIAIEMPAAIRPYSMAVAPSSLRKNRIRLCMTYPL
jgi:hypothetical protein